MRRGERRRGDEREREKVNERPTDRSDHWIRRFIHGAEGGRQSPKGQRAEQRRYHINPLRSPPSLPLPGPVTRKGHLRSHSISRRRCAAAGGGANNPTKASPIFRSRAADLMVAEPSQFMSAAAVALIDCRGTNGQDYYGDLG